MGHYVFQGMHAAHPFYKLMDHGVASTTSRPSTSGRPSISTPTPVPVQYLFFDAKHKQWIFAPVLGKDSGVDFGSVQNSPAKCPGDPPAANNWQYKTSVLQLLAAGGSPGANNWQYKTSVLHRWKKST